MFSNTSILLHFDFQGLDSFISRFYLSCCSCYEGWGRGGVVVGFLLLFFYLSLLVFVPSVMENLKHSTPSLLSKNWSASLTNIRLNTVPGLHSFACLLQEAINYQLVGNYPALDFFTVDRVTGQVTMNTSLLSDSLLLEAYEVSARAARYLEMHAGVSPSSQLSTPH